MDDNLAKAQGPEEQVWEMESLNDEDIAIDTLDERVEFSTVRALWDCNCDGGNTCGLNGVAG